jgi:outer membrane protein OmpA-like peptidoglycan-associated protein
VRNGGPLRAWLAIAAVSIAAACGPKQVSSPSQPGQDLIVLLPDSDTKTTGAAGVSNPRGSVDLAAERDAATVTANSAPVLSKMSAADVQSIFGDALSALPPAPRRFTLFFRFESDELTDQSQALIPEILAAVKEHAVQDVVVIGHTDTMGTQQANFGLGLKRALMVRNLLVAAGLNGPSIEATSVGELDPLVKTADETPEPRNRRVDISVR